MEQAAARKDGTFHTRNTPPRIARFAAIPMHGAQEAQRAIAKTIGV